MHYEDVIAQWIKNHPYISTPEWGAQNLLIDLELYGYQIVEIEDDE